jgi:hypothetical protein
MRRSTAILLLALPVGACRSAPAPAARAAPSGAAGPSALGAMVQVLAAIDRFERPGVRLRLRAVEADALMLQAPRRERVRVFVHLTTWADSLERAQSAFAELRDELESTPLPAGADTDVFRERDWSSTALRDESSYSDLVRVEVAPAAARPARPLPLPPGPPSAGPLAPATASAAAFLEDIARATGLGIQAVRPRLHAEPDGRRELRCLVRPATPDAHDTLTAIATFLEAVEAASPGARWTHLEIERALHLPEALQPNGWTFEGELALAEP